MKILSAQQIREADAYTIAHEPIVSIDLMERAAAACTNWILKHFPQEEKFLIFCGPGNNGGDGLAIARLLSNQGKKVIVYILKLSENFSEDFKINKDRLLDDAIEINELNTSAFSIPKEAIIVDAIFGSGLNKPVTGRVGGVIDQMNAVENPVISIDIPSGLFCDDNSENSFKHIVRATHTLTFQLPKLAFLFAENFPFVGSFHILPIGIDESFIQSVASKNFFVTKEMAKANFKVRAKFSHKGTYGHALIIAGSKGKMGAALLASEACLRAGAGLLTTHVPACGYEIMQTALPEAMCSVASEENFINELPKIGMYNAIGAGPGLGTEKQTQNVLKLLIQNTQLPLVLDADALNILSENKTWLSFLSPGTILTPHPKEFDRLTGSTEKSYARYEQLKSFALKYQVYVVLKGAHTAIASPDGEVFFNSSGNPGMATGGSGDVLTGIITALLAQDYSPKMASVLGVYLHGLAADCMLIESAMESLIAGDIIEGLALAFMELKQ